MDAHVDTSAGLDLRARAQAMRGLGDATSALHTCAQDSLEYSPIGLPLFSKQKQDATSLALAISPCSHSSSAHSASNDVRSLSGDPELAIASRHVW